MDAKLVALKLFLAEVDVSEEIAFVSDRKRLQKAVYIGQLSGVDLGYRYGWYLMGPYSPTLTRDYYDLNESIDEGDREYESMELTAVVRDKLSRVKPLFNVPGQVKLPQEDWLELISSIHFLNNVSGYSWEEVRVRIDREKPHLTNYVNQAKTALEKVGLL